MAEKSKAIKAIEVTDISVARALADGFKLVADQQGQGAVANSIIHVLSGIGQPEVLKGLKEDIRKPELPLRVRGAYFKSLDSDSSEDMAKFFQELADDSAATLRMLAITALGKRGYEPAFDTVAQRMNDGSWRVKLAAANALADYGIRDAEKFRDRALALLISALQTERGRMLEDVSSALKKLTGENYGVDPHAWHDWHKRTKGGTVEPRDPAKGTRPRAYYGNDTYSTQVIYVIDMSVSMLDPVDPELAKKIITGAHKDKDKKDDPSKPKEPGQDDNREPIDWSKITCKLDLAKAELKRTLKSLPEDVWFTIVAYSTKVEKWKEEIVPATEANKKAAIAYIDTLKCTELTNIFGALDEAIGMCEKNYDDAAAAKAKKGAKQITGAKEERVADTIWFLTDGFATTGKYKGPDMQGEGTKEDAEAYNLEMKEMLSEIRQRNEIARVTIHAIGIGNREVDTWTLKRLAQENNGIFVQVGDGKKPEEKRGGKK